ncbi:hypothetical protein [uncultured Roseobacter sp.]|uniref:hypothetical protein n=1 Tax=uncultured Roseobacter sp. TaxID=114847 RepID=UPI00260F0FA2|nr:hypothetical protein [uncultured Roseobacter sp.]
MKRNLLLFFNPLLFAAAYSTAAFAGDIMNSVQLGALITGNTLYVEIPAGAPGAPDGGTAPIYYAGDGSAVALLPAGLKLVGSWTIAEDQYCIDWENGPKNSCTQLVRSDAGFVVTDTKLGEPRGVVTRLATGNPENL